MATMSGELLAPADAAPVARAAPTTAATTAIEVSTALRIASTSRLLVSRYCAHETRAGPRARPHGLPIRMRGTTRFRRPVFAISKQPTPGCPVPSKRGATRRHPRGLAVSLDRLARGVPRPGLALVGRSGPHRIQG